MTGLAANNGSSGVAARQLHQALVDELAGKGYIRTPRVEAAFRAVPRHFFLPGLPFDQVYNDEAIPTKQLDGSVVSSSSQPAIMAIMLEQLALEPGHRVLEIGAGTGYNAALMAHIVGDAGRVVTMDIDEDLVAGAREHLSAAGFDTVQVVYGLVEGASMSVLMRPPGQSLCLDEPMDSPPFELFVRSFGPDQTLAQRLIAQVTAWEAAGRPGTDGLRLRAYPRDVQDAPSAGEIVIEKRWTRLVLDWNN